MAGGYGIDLTGAFWFFAICGVLVGVLLASLGSTSWKSKFPAEAFRPKTR